MNGLDQSLAAASSDPPNGSLFVPPKRHQNSAVGLVLGCIGALLAAALLAPAAAEALAGDAPANLEAANPGASNDGTTWVQQQRTTTAALDETTSPSQEGADVTEPDRTTAVETTEARSTTSEATTTTSEDIEISQPIEIQPVSIQASNEREPVDELRCGGSNSFGASGLIDGDPQTGWGASKGDGSGQWVVIDLGAERRLTSIGLTPGYFRYAPRFSEGCRVTGAFGFNRFVEAVRFVFDDGSSVEKRFSRSETAQYVSVDVSTRQVWMEVLSTGDWGEDTDTIISDIFFEGF